jgi:hypothetical protein
MDRVAPEISRFYWAIHSYFEHPVEGDLRCECGRTLDAGDLCESLVEYIGVPEACRSECARRLRFGPGLECSYADLKGVFRDAAGGAYSNGGLSQFMRDMHCEVVRGTVIGAELR